MLEAGLETTVQDVGRFGYLAPGIPPAGAFDSYSLRVGNLLAGNDPGGPYIIGGSGDAGLETLLMGLKLKVLHDTVIVVTGADLNCTLNEKPLPMWRTIRVQRDDIITFKAPRAGVRAYICAAGGIDVPVYLGSRSTYVRGKIGGFNGRKLQKGDVLKTGAPSKPLAELEERVLRAELIPRFSNRSRIRVILGPHDNLFTAKSVDSFLVDDWKVSAKADRMGVRFLGPKLEYREHPRILPGIDPSNIPELTTPFGAIQFASVELIALNVEFPSLGGFTIIATIISPDVSLVGQMKSGDIANFEAVEPQDAIYELEKVENRLTKKNVLSK
ncbi:MAG: biotin-dependent carboxyltransferase family protein [Candidatus Bathyarchaeia archaeon]